MRRLHSFRVVAGVGDVLRDVEVVVDAVARAKIEYCYSTATSEKILK